MLFRSGLRCVAGVIDAGCAHSFVLVGARKPRDLPQFTWVNTVLGNLKTMIGGTHKSFKFRKYASQYLGAFCYRLNHRFDVCQPVTSLISHAATFSPVPERVIRGRAEVHDWSGHPKTKRQGVVIIISTDEALLGQRHCAGACGWVTKRVAATNGWCVHPLKFRPPISAPSSPKRG